MLEENTKNNKMQSLNKKSQYDLQLSVLGKGIKCDWLFLVSILVLSFVAISAYSYLNHKRISGLILSESEINKNTTEILNNEQIQKLMEEFEKREKVLNNFE